MSRSVPLVVAIVLISVFAVPGTARAVTILGTGSGALLRSDLTDPENDINDNMPNNPPYYGTGYNFVAAGANQETWFSPGKGGWSWHGEAALDLFDNKVGGGEAKWCCGGQWLWVQFPRPIILTHFTIASANDASYRDPDIWRIEGSNDGSNWTTIFSYDNDGNSPFSARNQVLLYESPEGPHRPDAGAADFSVPAAYSYIRYRRLSVINDSKNQHQLSELEYFGRPAGFGGVHHLDISPLFNADQIVNFSGGSLDTTQDGIDAGGQVYMTASAAAHIGGSAGTGLPDDGLFPHTPLGFPVQLGYSNADDGPNAIRLTGGQSVSMTLGAADQLIYGTLYLFATNGSGDGQLRVDLGYEDGSTGSQTFVIDDWFNDGNQIAPRGGALFVDGLDRCYRTGTSFHNANDPGIFAIPLQTSFEKRLTSITFTRVGGSGVTTIFGVSGLVPEPGTLSVLALGALMALARRRRRA